MKEPIARVALVLALIGLVICVPAAPTPPWALGVISSFSILSLISGKRSLRVLGSCVLAFAFMVALLQFRQPAERHESTKLRALTANGAQTATNPPSKAQSK